MWIHEHKKWSNFTWNDESLTSKLASSVIEGEQLNPAEVRSSIQPVEMLKALLR